MNSKLFTIAVFLFLLSCKEDSALEDLPSISNPNLEYFGYTLVDVYWDDPTDNENKANYTDEVANFSNIADILVVDPSQDIIPNLEIMEGYQVKALLHLNEIFFEFTESRGSKSGVLYDLRSDYKERWNLFVENNNISKHKDKIAAFYIGEEPTWNDILFEELKMACDYAKLVIPDVPILIVEAYPSISELQVPESVDWLAFDHYFIEDPENDPTFLAELELLKQKRSNNQKMFLILDAHFIDFAHGSVGLDPEDMDFVARSYFNLANNDHDIIGLIGFHWPNGFDFEQTIGARSLPENVMKEHMQIGKAITNK